MAKFFGLGSDTIGLPAGMVSVALGSKVPIVVADTTQPDDPLVLVNDAFCTMTGRKRREMLGRNCRFLQPKGGAGPAVGRIREFLDDKAAVEGNFVLPNERKNGTRFLNLLYLAKIKEGETTRFVLGSQFDISAETIEQLKTYGEELQQDMIAMNDALAGTELTGLPHHEDLTETLDYVATYRKSQE